MSGQGDGTGASGDSNAVSARAAARSRQETIFLGSIVSVSLAATIVLLVLASKGVFFPAMGIAILAATGVATLVYAFLGGQGDSFTVQGMKLAGAAAVFAIIVWIVDGRLNSQMRDMRAEAAAQRAAAAQAARATPLIVLDSDLGFQPIGGGAFVRLVEVTSLDGWLEGDPVRVPNGWLATHGSHEDNKSLPDAAEVFTYIFKKESIHRPVDEVLKMSQSQWEAFLDGLRDNKRKAVSGIPFARLETRDSDGRTATETVFKGEAVRVTNPAGKVEAVLCVQRILDTRQRSQEPEVVVLRTGTETCAPSD
jgi:hypothetical protein